MRLVMRGVEAWVEVEMEMRSCLLRQAKAWAELDVTKCGGSFSEVVVGRA
jgi:hypothetical protein